MDIELCLYASSYFTIYRGDLAFWIAYLGPCLNVCRYDFSFTEKERFEAIKCMFCEMDLLKILSRDNFSYFFLVCLNFDLYQNIIWLQLAKIDFASSSQPWVTLFRSISFALCLIITNSYCQYSLKVAIRFETRWLWFLWLLLQPSMRSYSR